MPDIIHAPTLPFKALGLKHRVGEPEFKHLFQGTDGLPSNYLFTLARQSSFYSPVHKHNFEQFRYAHRGSFSIGPTLTIQQGELCYHPEGVEYGPQIDKEDGEEHVLLVLQFGGVSGQGYISYDRLLQVQKELGENGRFEKGMYYENGNENGKDGFQACWEKVNGRELIYPKAKFNGPDLVKTGSLEWSEGSGHVKSKTLGEWTERKTRAEMVKIEDGGSFEVKGEKALQLIFICEGSGKVGIEDLEAESAVRLIPGEGSLFSSESRLVMLRLVIPTLD